MSSDTIQILLKALGETIYMVGISTILSIVIGFIFAIVMILTAPNGLRPIPIIYKVLDVIVNVLRSFPFIILIVVVSPLSRLILGTSIGPTAVIIPLTIAAAPFVTRVIESSLKEVDYGVVEAAKSFGASDMQIIFKVMLKESYPSILNGIILTIISIVGYSAMAGAIGGGGLGDVAINYGYYRFETDITVYTVIVIIALVQLIQAIGTYAYRKMTR